MKVHPYPDEQGTAMVEFAISAVVLVMLIFGCIGVSLAFYTFEVVNQYARDASRYAIVHGNGCTKPGGASCSIGTAGTANAALKTYLNHQIYPGIKGASLGVSTTYAHAPGLAGCFAAGCNGGGDQVTVTVTYPYLYNIPFVPKRLITMHGNSTMIISQ